MAAMIGFFARKTVARNAVSAVRHRPRRARRAIAPVPARRIWILAAFVGSLAAAVAAQADVLPAGSIRALPPRAGAATRLVVNASFDQPAGAELLAYNVDFARGFVFDPRAAAGRCTASQARAAACPVSSKIGGGTGQLSVAGHSLARTQFTVAISFYIMRPQRPGDVAGLVLAAREPKSGVNFALVGRLVHVAGGTYGLELRFANTAGELPPGLQVQLKHVHVVFGTERMVALHAGHRTTRVTYQLLTNPRSCPRSGWPLLLTVSYSTGTEHYLGRAACTAAR